MMMTKLLIICDDGDDDKYKCVHARDHKKLKRNQSTEQRACQTYEEHRHRAQGSNKHHQEHGNPQKVRET